MNEAFLLELYRQMVLIRHFELRAIDERRQGLIPGFIHPYVGQEACAVGACAALTHDDVITSTHRGHGHLIAKGGDVRYMMAELAARESGYCAGKGGSLHMTDFDLGIMGANGIVAGGLPMAVGAGLAFKKQAAQQGNKSMRVAVAFFGDGATNEGAFHESLNLAGLWKLPVIFFCENNQYGEGTPQHKQAPVQQLSKRADSYAIPGITVDGNDIMAVYDVMQYAVQRARSGQGPSFIEGLTYRYRGHYEGDPQVYRDVAEVQAWQARDPLPACRRILLQMGVDEGQIEDVEGAVFQQIELSVMFAKAAPKAKVNDALAGVYADTHGGMVF